MRWLSKALLFLLVFLIPIEHRYDEWCHRFYLKWIPVGLSLPHWFEKRIYFYLSDLLALVLFGLSVSCVPLKRLFLEKTALPLWIIFVCAVFSLILSPLAHYPVIYIRLLQLLTPILLCISLAHVSFGRPFFLALLFTALFQTAIALAQYFSQSSIGLRFLHEPVLGPESPSFLIAGGKRWLFDSFWNHSSEMAAIFRVPGTFSNPNVLGGFLVFSLLGTYSLFEGTSKKFLLSLSLGLQLFALTITYSRAALFAWALGTLVWFFRMGTRSWWLISTLLIASTLVGTLLHEQLFQRGGFVNSNYLTEKADAKRFLHQEIAYKMIRDHPLFGVGLAQHSFASLSYLPADSHHAQGAVHNIYLFLAAEMGLISLGAFLFFLAVVLGRAWQAPPSFETSSLFAILIAFLFIGCCDFYLICSQEGKLMFFTTIGLILQKHREVLPEPHHPRYREKTS